MHIRAIISALLVGVGSIITTKASIVMDGQPQQLPLSILGAVIIAAGMFSIIKVVEKYEHALAAKDRGRSNVEFGAYITQAETVLRSNPQLRRGQAYFNVLHRMRPDLADQVRSVHGLDPFYKDEYLPDFLTWLAENWDEDNEVSSGQG